MDIEKLKCKECGQEFTKIDCVTRQPCKDDPQNGA